MNRHDKVAFIYQLDERPNILDVGYANNSAELVKKLSPQSVYTGIDIVAYDGLSEKYPSDHFVVTTPEKFADAILGYDGCFDAVISTHNIEHCFERERTLDAMLRAVKVGGQIYLAFPCKESVEFPSRSGTLNYYDDTTHRDLPPDFDEVMQNIVSRGFKIEFSVRRYRPILYWLAGLVNERNSRKSDKTVYSTWAYYGFESIIQARRHS